MTTGKNRVYQMVLAAVLCAIGIIIPIISPVKILLGPMSFTLASHVAIFIAMFISPWTAAFVAVSTALGFQLYGFPIVIVARAASHVIFAFMGAWILKKRPEILDRPVSIVVFGLFISVVHALGEILAVTPFYIYSGLSDAYYSSGYIKTVLGLVGGGTVVHSLVDYAIALLVWKPLRRLTRTRTQPAM